MQEQTLVRALAAVRQRLVDAEKNATNWLAQRDRRRRQEAAFLRGIVRSRGSQRQAALATGLHHSTVSRILDRDGHKKARVKQAQRDVARRQNLATPAGPDEPEETMPTNVVKLKRRRPGWKPRQPRRAETYRWLQQFLEWTPSVREQFRLLIRDSIGDLPDAAYYDDGQQSPGGERTVGAQKRHAKGASR